MGASTRLALLPAIGLVLGGVAALVAAAVAMEAPALAGPAGVLALEAMGGLRARRALATGPLGVWGAIAALGVKLGAAASIPPLALTTALVLAPLLGRWAMVVQCHGGAGEGTPRAGVREFGIASVTAFATTLAAADALGLLLLVVAAATTVGLRVLTYRRPGGRLTRARLLAAGETVETVVLLVLAALGAVGGGSLSKGVGP